MDNEVLYNERRKKANAILLKALSKVDPDQDDSGVYADIAQLYAQLNLDIKNEMDAILREKELEVEQLKIDKEAEAKAKADLTEQLKIRTESESKAKADETERMKIETESKVKAKAIEAEKERTASESKSEKRKAILDAIGKVAIGVGTVFTAGTQIWMFKRSTKFEDESALLTQSSQTVVRNGLSGKGLFS